MIPAVKSDKRYDKSFFRFAFFNFQFSFCNSQLSIKWVVSLSALSAEDKFTLVIFWWFAIFMPVSWTTKMLNFWTQMNAD